MNEKHDILRGKEAAMVLENEAFKAALVAMKTAVIDQWKQCPVRDREGQLLLLQLAKLTDKFEGILIGYVENGKLAKNKVEMDELRNESKTRRYLRRITG